MNENTITIIEDCLYFTSYDENSSLRPNTLNDYETNEFIFFNTDEILTYQRFFADFGPLNISKVVRFCHKLDNILKNQGYDINKLKNKNYKNNQNFKKMIYWCDNHQHKRVNSAFLIGSWLLISLNYSIEYAYQPFINIKPSFIPYRDAAFGVCSFPLLLLDCMRGVYKAITLNHFNYDIFDPDEYDFYDKIENGDISWIIPGKFLAFSGPHDHRREIEPGKFTMSVDDYVSVFRRLQVNCIIRFNKKCYDKRKLTQHGFRHVDLYYEDGSNPPDHIWQSFLQVCESEGGVIAVHCKAGLGRTGTNIVLYMMKHYGYASLEATAWCRICRPGSVVGPQQQYVKKMEKKMWLLGEKHRNKNNKKNNSNNDLLLDINNEEINNNTQFINGNKKNQVNYQLPSSPIKSKSNFLFNDNNNNNNNNNNHNKNIDNNNENTENLNHHNNDYDLERKKLRSRNFRSRNLKSRNRTRDQKKLNLYHYDESDNISNNSNNSNNNSSHHLNGYTNRNGHLNHSRNSNHSTHSNHSNTSSPLSLPKMDSTKYKNFNKYKNETKRPLTSSNKTNNIKLSNYLKTINHDENKRPHTSSYKRRSNSRLRYKLREKEREILNNNKNKTHHNQAPSYLRPTKSSRNNNQLNSRPYTSGSTRNRYNNSSYNSHKRSQLKLINLEKDQKVRSSPLFNRTPSPPRGRVK